MNSSCTKYALSAVWTCLFSRIWLLVEDQLDVFSAWRLTHTANVAAIPMIVASTSSTGTRKR